MLRNQFVKKSRKNRISRKRQSKRGISRKLRQQQGGAPVNLTQIMITKPVVDAIKAARPLFDARAENFKMYKGEQGFALNRMAQMMAVVNFDDFLTKNPVSLKAEAMFNGLPLYAIVDGRHRVTRAIIQQKQQIEATIIP